MRLPITFALFSLISLATLVSCGNYVQIGDRVKGDVLLASSNETVALFNGAPANITIPKDGLVSRFSELFEIRSSPQLFVAGSSELENNLISG